MSEMLGEHFPYPQSDFAKEHYGRGVADGRREGESELLFRQLTVRFGELHPEVEARVRQADGDILLRWGERFVAASTLDAND